MLKVLEVEGVVERSGSKWRRTPMQWAYPEARVDGGDRRAPAEQQRMHEYLERTPGASWSSCRGELDDPAAAPCGRCARCIGRTLVPVDIDRELAREARYVPRGQSVTVEPRKQWPDGKKIPAELRAETGRVLSHYGDGGWGTLVQEQTRRGAYSDELAWAWLISRRSRAFDAEVEWVTCVPSLRTPGWFRAWRRGWRTVGAAVRAGRREDPRDVAAAGDEQQRAAVRQRPGRVRSRRPVPGAGPADRRHRRFRLDADRGRGAAARTRRRPRRPHAPGAVRSE